jgi:hypothetical protein
MRRKGTVMTRNRFFLFCLGSTLALTAAGCGEEGKPVPPMGAGADLADLPEGERLAEEQFQKKTQESEAKNAAKAAKAAKKP